MKLVKVKATSAEVERISTTLKSTKKTMKKLKRLKHLTKNIRSTTSRSSKSRRTRKSISESKSLTRKLSKNNRLLRRKPP
jgi:hypothetical protein